MSENRDETPKPKRASVWNDPDRWSRGVLGGKSPLQIQMEKELEEKRRQHELENPKAPRKPLKWYWWVAIAVGLALWSTVSFLTYDWTA